MSASDNLRKAATDQAREIVPNILSHLFSFIILAVGCYSVYYIPGFRVFFYCKYSEFKFSQVLSVIFCMCKQIKSNRSKENKI